jgi:hypothetical protein
VEIVKSIMSAAFPVKQYSFTWAAAVMLPAVTDPKVTFVHVWARE